MDSAFLAGRLHCLPAFLYPREVRTVKRRKHALPARLLPEQLKQYRLAIGRMERSWVSGTDEEVLREEYRQLRLDRGIGRAVYLSYSDPELLDLLRSRQQQLGRAPAQKEVFFLYRSYLKARFGTWPAALRAAGMRAMPAPTLGNQDWAILTGQEGEICNLLGELRQLQRKMGKPPRRRDFPEAQRLRERFGSWENVLAAMQSLEQWQAEQNE